MRNSILIAALLTLVVAATGPATAAGKTTQDPNVGGAVKEQNAKMDPLKLDKRLDRRVTYWAANEPVSSVLSSLGRLAGVKLSCGVNNDDWQVRDRKMNVFATGVPLRDLMRSIARVMKFRWSVNDEKPPWTYRLYMVRPELLEAQALLRKQDEEYERRMTEKRKAFVDKSLSADSLSPTDLERLKQTDPAFYFDVKQGIAGPLARIFREAPRFRDAFLSAGNTTCKASELSPQAQQAVLEFIRGASSRSKMLGESRNTWAIPEDIGKRVGDLRVSISAFKHVDDSTELPGMVLGGMEVRTDETDKHYVTDFEAFFPFGILDTQCDHARIQAGLEIRAVEQGKKLFEVLTEQDSVDLTAAAAKLKNALPSEPLIEHPRDSAPLEKVKLKPESDRLADVEQALADASSFAIVSDNFGASSAYEGGLPSGEVTVREALDKIGTAYNYNWDMHARVIELRDRQWFRKRSLQLPEAWLEKWRKTFKETGTLDLDDLAQLARLSTEQYRANISQDGILGGIGTGYTDNFTLKAYALMNDAQRAALFNEGGLGLGVFSMDPRIEGEITRPMAWWFFDNRSPRTAKGKTLYATRVKKGRVYEYTFRAVADDPNLEPLKWKLTTPEYKEPQQTKDR